MFKQHLFDEISFERFNSLHYSLNKSFFVYKHMDILIEIKIIKRKLINKNYVYLKP